MSSVKKAFGNLIVKLFANFGSKKFQATITALIVSLSTAPHFSGWYQFAIYALGILPTVLFVIVESVLDLAGIIKGKSFEDQLAKKISDLTTTFETANKDINSNIQNNVDAVSDAVSDIESQTK